MQISLEKHVITKVGRRIVPFIMLLYFVAYLDRVNIGFAALTMNHDIGLSQAAFGLGAGIFFIGYFLFEVPSNLILHRVGARMWIARIMVTWGIISGAMAFVQGPISFYVLRFFLGVAEAGFFPGIILYLSYWFPARYRARIIALFMAAVPLSIAIGSPISGALMSLDGLLGFYGWQWMFILEAVPAIILGGVVLSYMTDRPEKAKWLTSEERDWLINEMDTEQREIEQKNGHNQSHGVFHALVDPRILILALIYLGTSAGLYTLGIWSPQIIAEFGVSPMMTGFINALPPVAAVIAMLLWARHSDKTGERSWHVVIACIVAAIGLLLASQATGLVAVVAALVVVNVGVSSAKAPLWSMPTQFLTGASAAAGIAAINSIGNLGGFLGPAIIGAIKSYTGSFEGGLIVVAVFLITSACLVLVLKQMQKKALPETAVIKNEL